MATVEGLNLRGSRYYLRVLIPEDLQAHYGKPRVNPSLRTSDKAEAVRKGLRLRAEWLEEFETKRKALNPQALEVITPELAQELAKAGRIGVLQRDQGMRDGKDGAFKALRKGVREQYERLSPQPRSIRMPNPDWPTPEQLPDLIPLGGISEWEAGVVSEVNTGRLEEARKNIARGNLLYFLPLLQWDAQAMGFTVTMETEGLKGALLTYIQSYLQALQEAIQRDNGELISTDSTLPVTQAPATPTGLPETLLRPTAVTAAGHSPTSLRDIFSQWLEAEPRTKDTEQAVSRALRAAEECLGSPLYVQQVTRAQGNTFKAWLQHPDRGTTPKTAKDKLSKVNTLLRFATLELEVIPKNPWQGLHIEVPNEVTRIPWTDQQLQTLFSQPLHQSYAIPPEELSGGGPAAYWIPLLGLYTGARITELAQLRVTDITEADGVPVIRITDEGEGQKVKTKGSRRSLPIHSELIRLGLLDYADEVRQENPSGSLWPLLKNPKLMSGWFSRYRKSIPGLEGKWLDFHSLRHTVRTRLAKAGVSEKSMDAITGHADGGSTGRKVYTHLDMEDLRKAIQKLSYSSIDLPRAYPPAGPGKPAAGL